MPALLRNVMLLSPSTHFVAVAQAVLYRGAGFDLIWERFLAMGAIGGLFLALSVWRFRSVSGQNG
jgi:ABC-2 type transport system permease protein